VDWRDPAGYVFDPPLSREEWAWQFLRRNPDYQADYAWFIATWRALESDYGAPPNRDYFKWKQDPRAWRAEAELAGCGTDVCPGENQQVLIECWMGAKWGLRKFPPDPTWARPIVEEQLAWREVPVSVAVLEGGLEPWLQQNPARIALGFDLHAPLAEQLEQARMTLLAERRARQRAGRLGERRPSEAAATWTFWLRLLDGVAAGEAPKRIGAELGLDDPLTALARARRLAAHDYRTILLMRE
jgi:hypothetical protein